MSEETEKLLQKIDFEKKRWVKSQIHCSKLKSRKDAIERICEVRDDVLETFTKHKEEIHEEVDPPSLAAISKVFDIRWWSLKKIENLKVSDNEFAVILEQYVLDKLDDWKPIFEGL